MKTNSIMLYDNNYLKILVIVTLPNIRMEGIRLTARSGLSTRIVLIAVKLMLPRYS